MLPYGHRKSTTIGDSGAGVRSERGPTNAYDKRLRQAVGARLTPQPCRTYGLHVLPQWIIEKKRDGNALSAEEIRSFIEGYATEKIPAYQMAALAMAVYFRGMTPGETAALTEAMLHSGEIVDTSSVPGPKVDKHSTGGIGDKVSLVLAPLVASCGVSVPMISGRALGITGGTLDKLEAIPGYRTDLDMAAFVDTVRQCGCSIIGQTSELAPADRKLYALRDVTGTVPSIPLISASIMSKKLAEGIDGLVLDVKWGRGAFMKTIEEARDLARSMVAIGSRMGKGMAAVLTDMNQPLGRTVGNALEVVETVLALQGEGPADLVEVTLALAARMLMLADEALPERAARDRLTDALARGEALARFCRMLRLHGADTEWIKDPASLSACRHVEPFPAPREGVVAWVDADRVGRAAMLLGAGRMRVEDAVDHATGLSALVKCGETVAAGQPLALLHANERERIERARELLADAFGIGPEPTAAAPLIVETIVPGPGAAEM